MIELTEYLDTVINRACDLRGIRVSPIARSYVVGMLRSFVDASALFEEDSGNRVLEPITFHNVRCNTPEEARLLGDHCLFLVGYFYEMIRKGGEGQVQYHCSVGSSAYFRSGKGPTKELFEEMGANFWDLGRAIGDLHLDGIDEKKLYNLVQDYSQTQDSRYADLLRAKGIQIGPHFA